MALVSDLALPDQGTRPPPNLCIGYENEESLEQCVRRIVLRKPERLRGWDVRFLRRGLDMTQAQLGEYLDRDAQTVARWEKSADVVSLPVDLAIRARFASVFAPEMTAGTLLLIALRKAEALPERVLLWRAGTGWRSSVDGPIECGVTSIEANLEVALPTVSTTIANYILQFEPLSARITNTWGDPSEGVTPSGGAFSWPMVTDHAPAIPRLSDNEIRVNANVPVRVRH